VLDSIPIEFDIVQKNGSEIIGGERYRLYIPSSGEENVEGRSRTIMASAETVIYPNPTTGNFTIKPVNLSQSYEVSISNAVGEVVYSHKGFTSELQIDGSAFGAGLYLVTIENNVTGETESRKLIVQD